MLLLKFIDAVLHEPGFYWPRRRVVRGFVNVTARLAAKSDTFTSKIVATFFATVTREALCCWRLINVAVVRAVRCLSGGCCVRAAVVLVLHVLLLGFHIEDFGVTGEGIV